MIAEPVQECRRLPDASGRLLAGLRKICRRSNDILLCLGRGDLCLRPVNPVRGPEIYVPDLVTSRDRTGAHGWKDGNMDTRLPNPFFDGRADGNKRLHLRAAILVGSAVALKLREILERNVLENVNSKRPGRRGSCC